MQQPETLQLVKEQNKHLREELERLQSYIRLLKREKFGSKSERVEILTDQLVFNEIEVEALKALPTPEKETITYTRNRGRGKKKPIPENVPREEVIIDLPAEEKICPHDGTPLKKIGESVSEKLKTIPAQSSVLIERRIKYACPCCESHVAQPTANSILPGTIATPELLSFLIYSKFFQSLPLYRLQEQFSLQGIELKRGTLARWLVQVSEKLIPIWNVLEEKVLDSGYMAIDATKVQVLKEKGRQAETKSSMWVRGSPELGIVLFDYDVSGGGAVAKKLVTGFKGALQADAHRGYNALDRNLLLLLGCMMHSRRRFHKAWLLGKKKPGIAEEALAMFKFIYDKEEQYKEKGLTPEQRKYWRDEEIGPSMEAIKQWCGWKIEIVPPKSPIANALSYFINEYTELTAFLKDGRYEIDNGWVERVIKRFAVGRRNWLFCDSVEGARASSILYSLALTSKLNSKNPFDVMVEILKQLPRAQTIDDYERLADLLLSKADLSSCHKKEGALIH
jgi:transposase